MPGGGCSSLVREGEAWRSIRGRDGGCGQTFHGRWLERRAIRAAWDGKLAAIRWFASGLIGRLAGISARGTPVPPTTAAAAAAPADGHHRHNRHYRYER